MDDTTFRRLALDGMRRKLEPDVQQQWEAHRDSNADAMRFVEDLVASHREISSRFVESKRLSVQDRQRNVDPAGDLQPTKLQTSDVIRLAWLFAIVSAIISGLITLYSLMGNDGDNQTSNWYIAEDNEPSDGNSPDLTPANNDAPANEPANTDSSNTNAANEHVNQPANNTNTQPDVEPEPPPAKTGVLAADLKNGKASFRAAGESEFHILRDDTELYGGERIRVTEGSVGFRSEGLSIEGSSRLDMTVIDSSDSGLSLEMFYGRAVVNSSKIVELVLYGNRVAFKDAAFVIDVNSTGSELFLLEGFVDIRRTDDFKRVSAPRHVVVSRGLNDRVLTSAEIEALEPELLGRHRTLLFWDFEEGRGVCNLGELAKGGVHGSKYAMRSKPVAGDVGTDLSGTLFVSAPGAQLKFKILTTAPQVRISARLQLEGGWRRVSMRANVPAGEGWRTVTIPLKNLAFIGNRSGTGWQPFVTYSRLIITALSDSGSVFNAPEMLVDDVHIYATE
ncbi:MAG: hypothetical protein ACYTDT_07295 [Planctomycetota bacterium]|jgi:hypothetical protein